MTQVMEPTYDSTRPADEDQNESFHTPHPNVIYEVPCNYTVPQPMTDNPRYQFTSLKTCHYNTLIVSINPHTTMSSIGKK